MANEQEFKEYESRKITIRALQFDPQNVHKFSLPPMVIANYQDARHPGLSEAGPETWPRGWDTLGITFSISTISGKSAINAGDFIVQERLHPNRYYPVERETFLIRYIS